MWTFDKVNGILEIPDPFYFDQKLTEDRNEYEITGEIKIHLIFYFMKKYEENTKKLLFSIIIAKLFYLPSSSTSVIEPSPPPQYVAQSIYHLFKVLGINTIDTFIVYFNGLIFNYSDEVDGSSSNDNFTKSDFDNLIKVWTELEKFHVNNRIHKLGVSEFTKNRLESFINAVEISPKVNQINIIDCNNGEILEFAKKNDIELLTHRDPTVILPSKTFRNIIEETNTNKISLNNDLLPRWVLKYSVMIKCRGVVANKGYIVMGSTPNSGLNFTYTIDH
ncbi:aldo-keto reductase superfamily protein [Rhizophagus irregularis DAOM 197198w]|uniref:GCS light chain n=1 Tax=Rhizophagus irregularis (strain DAOM 197198w) TaxID=1432141 RepID=A0A015KD72_RHIIW|nr:aldo-keto reductase superfamily protein [Rhizophagus irregularis DAOM 197198w]